MLLKISNNITSWICCIIQYYTNLRCGQVVEQGRVRILITRSVRLERDQCVIRLFRCGAYSQPLFKGLRLSGYLSNSTRCIRNAASRLIFDSILLDKLNCLTSFGWTRGITHGTFVSSTLPLSVAAIFLIASSTLFRTRVSL